MPFDTHWSLAEAVELADLCRAIIDRRLDAGAARAELTRIVSRKSAYSKVLVALAWAVYGGAVAIRVGGHWIEGLAGALIGVVAGGIHLLAAKHKQVGLEKTFLGAFLDRSSFSCSPSCCRRSTTPGRCSGGSRR